MSLTIKNHGASAQTRGVWFTLPEIRAAVVGDHIELSSGEFAHRVGNIENTVLYSVVGTWASGEETPTIAAGTYTDEDSFALHPGYGESACGEVTRFDRRWIPQVFRIVGGTAIEAMPGVRENATITERFSSPWFKEWVVTHHQAGWHLDVSIRLWSGQAIAEVVASAFWSDDEVDGWTIPCEQFQFRFGQEVRAYFWATDNEQWVSSNSGRQWSLDLDFNDQPNVSEPGNTRQNWSDQLYHGRRLTLRGDMFGRGTTVDAGDEAKFLVSEVVRCHADASEWAGGWGASGQVPAEPGNVTKRAAVRPPAYADTTRSYVNWNRGGGWDATNGVGGIVPAFRPRATSQGGLGMVGGGIVLRGYQDLVDLEIASADQGLRPRYVHRDGSFPDGSQPTGFYTVNGYPDVSNRSRNWGSKVSTSWSLPANGGGADGFDTEHMSSMTTWPWYLLSLDYVCERLMVEEAAIWWTHQIRRGRLSSGSPFSGHRAWGRTFNALIQMSRACPAARPMLQDALFNQAVGSMVYGALTRLVYRTNPPTTTSPRGTLYHMHWPGLVTPAAQFEGNDYTRTWDPLWTMIGTIGIWMAWEETRDPQFLDAYEKIASSTILFGSVYLPVLGDNSYAGWYISLHMLGSVDTVAGSRTGHPLSDEVRTYGHPLFTTMLYISGNPNGTGGGSYGGDDLRSWAAGGLELYLRVGTNPAARARAQQCLNSIRRGNATAQTWGETMRAAVTGFVTP